MGTAAFSCSVCEAESSDARDQLLRQRIGELYFPASVAVERGGLRVGIIGVAATIIDKSMPPHFSEGVRFTSGCEELPGEISCLRNEGTDLIVVLSHLGFPQDVHVALFC